MTGYTFSQLIDFTRTSAATYVNSAGNIVSTPASVNLLTYTQEFDNAAWTKTASTITANSTAAPDGTMTADTLVETAATSGHVVSSSATVTTSAHVFSVYLKKGSGSTAPNWLQLYTGGVSAQYANFNLGTGAVGSVAAGSTATITSVGNGWYRCTLTFTPSSGGSASVAIAFTNNTDTTTRGLSYAGATTSDVLAWGAQLELGSTASTYTRNFGGLFPARFDYTPVTLAPRGLLIEEQRTNLITYSEQIDNAAWTKNAATVTANAATSPDGTTNADKIVPNTTNTVHGAYRTQTYGAGTFTFSFYAKADGYPRVGVRSYDGASYVMQVTFDISAGTVVSATAGTASIQDAGNGWYRCVVTATTAGNLGATVGTWIEPLPAGAIVQTAYTGDGTSGILVYGVQLETGSFATSYIPTVASQVTRTADVATITGANFSQWYNQSSGTFVVEAVATAFPTGTSNNAIVTVSDGTNNNRQSLYSFNNVAYGATVNGNVVQANPTSGSGLTAGNVYKLAYAYATNDFALSTNGAAVGTDTSGTVPTVNQMQLGRQITYDQLNGWIRSVRYYPTRLTNAQLQALTA